MPSLRVHHAVDPTLLLERASDGFLDPPTSTAEDPFPSPRYLLALRQGGLRDDLIELAATRGCPGWFDPPLCVFHELPEWLGHTTLRPVGDFERLALVDACIRRNAGEVFGRVRRADEYVDAVDRLFGELVSEGVTPSDYSAALDRCADRDDFERRRDAELVSSYRAYVDQLAADQRRDGRDALLDCAHAVRTDPSAVGERLGGRREIRILGLQDLRGGWRHLLRALAESPALDRVEIFTAHPLELGDLPHERVRLEEPRSAAVRLFTEPGDTRVHPSASHQGERAGATSPSPTRSGETADTPGRDAAEHHVDPAITLLDAPDAEREAEEIACRIRSLVDAGVPPHRIAVVTRKARPHVDLALSALGRAGVPVTARRRTAYEEIPSVRAILVLFAAAAEGWSRHALVEIAEHPYIGCDLDAHVLDAIGYRRSVRGLDEWRSALASFSRQAAEREARMARGDATGEDLRRTLPPAATIDACAAAMERFAAEARMLDAARPLTAWVEWLDGLLARDPWELADRMMRVTAERFDVVRLDLAGWQGLREILREWNAALRRWPPPATPIAVAEFDQLLRAMLRADVALWTPARRGVLVLEALAAQYRSFDHVFIVGLESGAFPSRARRSPILDDRERQALAEAGLPIERRELWELRERELFRSLVAGARRSLTLSFARMDAEGRDVIRSALVEELGDVAPITTDTIETSRVVTPMLPLHREPETLEHAVRVAGIERHREVGLAGGHDGRITDPALLEWLGSTFGDDRLWSPTQLEEYAKCPWAYFANRLLGLERPEDPDDDLDPAVRGSILHATLQRFYDGCCGRASGAPILLRDEDREWAHAELAAALDAVLADEGSFGWLGHPALHEARRLELGRMLASYLDFELDLNEKSFNNRTKRGKSVRTGVTRHEHGFEELVLERDGVRVRYRGTIDRIEESVDERIPDRAFVAAVDYKTSKWAAPGGGDKTAWTDGVVLQLPLYAHALRTLYPHAELTRIEYRALRQRDCVHEVLLHAVDTKSGAVSERDEEHARLEAALDRVVDHVKRARAGEFPARPASSCGCPTWCHGWDICRVPGGPRSKAR